jgi:hypothetical protein
MSNLDTIKQRMHEINNEWIRVRKQEIKEQKEILKKHIGRCFKKEDADTWCVIIDVPHECHTKTGIDFNEHQLPAMFLYFNSLDYDTFFTGDLPEVEHPLKSMQKVFWKEISPELFWKVYDRFCNTVREQVQGRVASAAASEFAKLAQSGLSKEKPNGGWFETNKKLAEEMSDE